MVKTTNGLELHDKLAKGINTLANAVASTLGPGGRNVLIAKEDGSLQITKDGVTVATNFSGLEDPVEHIGMTLIKKVSEKAVDKAGDGTTTATVLAASLVNEGLKVITAGANNIEVKKGIDKAVKLVVGHLKSISEDISSEEQIKQVATISGNNDPEIGQLIATALEKVGTDGVVYIEESKTGETTLESVEGMQFDRGLKSPYFVTDNALMQATLEKPYILLYDDKIMNSKQVVNLLNAAANSNRPVLIIADDIEGEALPLLIVNNARGIVKVAAVKAPEYGERKIAMLEDIATLTGGTVISTKKGLILEKIKIEEFQNYFGEARMVTSDAKTTTIIDGKGDKDVITTRLSDIKAQLDNAKSPFEAENLQGRLAKLSGGVAIINVGGLSEIEMKEKKDRVDDALHATKAALAEGIVPGGGIALIQCVDSLESDVFSNKDQILGRDIVKLALYAPFTTILANAGINDWLSVYGQIDMNKQDIWKGYNVKTEEYVSMKDAGVLDPTKVTRTALEQAASVAGTILTTQSSVYAIPEPKTSIQQPDLSNYM